MNCAIVDKAARICPLRTSLTGQRMGTALCARRAAIDNWEDIMVIVLRRQWCSEKKDELERYPYEEKDIGNKKAAVPTKKESSHTDSPSAPSSPNTVGENDLPFTSPLLKSKRIITLPFLLPRYAVVSSASSTRDRMAGIYLAKVLYHRTYHLNQVRQHL